MTNVVASFYSSSIGLEVMDKSAFCLFCAVLALLEWSTEASLSLDIELDSYINPTRESSTGMPCNTSSGICNNEFHFCLQPSSSDTVSCPFGMLVTNTTQNDNFTFGDIAILQELGISNPLNFPDFLPMGSFKLITEVTNIGSGTNQLVDKIIVEFPDTLITSMMFTQPMSYSGQFQKATIILGYRITSNCPNTFYGENCSIPCDPQDSELGHYTCTYLGKRNCLQNYYQPDNNCSIFCEPRDDSSGHYSCNGRGGIICLDDYTDTASNCTEKVQGESDADSGDSSFESAGAIVAYIFVGYFLLLFSIVAVFFICFVRCNCQCVECCDSKYCFRPRCSPKLTRKQRFQIQCPKVITRGADAVQESCCQYCCGDDECDADQYAFWIEIVLLAILCFSFLICFIALYAYGKNATA